MPMALTVLSGEHTEYSTTGVLYSTDSNRTVQVRTKCDSVPSFPYFAPPTLPLNPLGAGGVYLWDRHHFQ